MASTGSTRTARHTGQATATIGRSTPKAAARTKGARTSGVSQTGSGSRDVNRPSSGMVRSQPISRPSTTPTTAISRPSSSGRTARVQVGLPRAMPMPISRRSPSTTRLMRFSAAKVAPISMSIAMIVQNSSSCSMSS